MREAAKASQILVQKLISFFNKIYWHIWDINVWNFNETLTNDVFSFEQPGQDQIVPEQQSYQSLHYAHFLLCFRIRNKLPYFFGYKTEFLPPKTIQKTRSSGIF